MSINSLVERCPYGVSLEVNAHVHFYLTIEEYIEKEVDPDVWDDTPSSVKKIIIASDKLVDLRFHPKSLLTRCYDILHYDVDKAIEEGNEILDALFAKVQKKESYCWKLWSRRKK